MFAFIASGLGYVALSGAGNIWLACAALIVAHAGGSVMWVFSTMTEDRFRGRVFSAEFAFSVVTMSASSSSAGFLIDHGLRPRMVAGFNGLVMLFPAVLWAWVLREWPKATNQGVRASLPHNDG